MRLSSPDGSVSPLDLRAYGEYDLRNTLLAIPGVAQVVAIGGELPQYRIDVRQDRLRSSGSRSPTWSRPPAAPTAPQAPATSADVERREMPIRQMARVEDLDDIRGTLVATRNGAPITIGDVADVRLAPAPCAAPPPIAACRRWC